VRGGPAQALCDRRVFHDTSSYGARSIDAVVRCVGIDQLVYGSDRPVVDAPDGPRRWGPRPPTRWPRPTSRACSVAPRWRWRRERRRVRVARLERLARGGPPLRRRMGAGQAVDFAAAGHPPRRARRRRAGDHDQRLFAAAVADGRLREMPTGELQRHSISEELRPLGLAGPRYVKSVMAPAITNVAAHSPSVFNHARPRMRRPSFS
jgi:hypothetical protein